MLIVNKKKRELSFAHLSFEVLDYLVIQIRTKAHVET